MTTTESRTRDRDGSPPPALTAAVLGLIAVALAVWAVAAIAETAARTLTSYAAVEVTVVDERVEERWVADRRGGSRAPIRVAVVELPDGTRADVRSDDLILGAAATVYRDDEGAVFEIPPPRPGLLEWGLCGAAVTAAVVLGAVSVRGVLRLRHSR